MSKRPASSNPKPARRAVRGSQSSRIGAQRDSERPVVLITAGPTQEPIDAVRFIGNRSSGKLGIAVAEAAAARGWRAILLLGPVSASPKALPGQEKRLIVKRFRTTEELRVLLHEHQAKADALVMAAAVADYRPAHKPGEAIAGTKLRRGSTDLTLTLEPTPDLLAGCAQRRREEHLPQLIVGFALEPKERLLSSAQDKLERKGIDAVVANELSTMEADTISATVVLPGGQTLRPKAGMAKAAFGHWLMEQVEEMIIDRVDGPCACGVDHAVAGAHLNRGKVGA